MSLTGQTPPHSRSMKLLNSLLQKELISGPINLHNSFEAGMIPQKPSESTPKHNFNKRHRNLSASFIKPPENREEIALYETKNIQSPDIQKFTLLNKNPSKEKLIKPLGNRPGPIRPVINIQKRGTSQQKPRNMNIFESNGINANSDYNSSKTMAFTKSSVVATANPLEKRKEQPESLGFRTFLEAAFQKDIRLPEQKSFAFKGSSSLNTSAERETEQNDCITNDFIITTENSQKPSLKKKRYYKLVNPTADSKQNDSNNQTSQISINCELPLPLQLENVKKESVSEQASPRNDEDENNFLDLIRRINQVEQPIIDYKRMFCQKLSLTENAKSITSHSKNKTTVSTEASTEEKQSLRKQRRDTSKNMAMPALEKKRLAYMKSIVPIVEEDESTRRSFVPSTGTKESGSWKSALSREKSESFQDVLEKLLESPHKSMREI